jgi:hypothetical protein
MLVAAGDDEPGMIHPIRMPARKVGEDAEPAPRGIGSFEDELSLTLAPIFLPAWHLYQNRILKSVFPSLDQL